MSDVIIDAWAHCGIRRFRPVDDVLRFMDAVGIAASALVQPLGDPDHEYLASAIKGREETFIAIGWADGADPGVGGTLRRLADLGVRGVRLTAADLIARPDIAHRVREEGLLLAVHAPDGTGGLDTALPPVGAEPWILIAHLGFPRVGDAGLERGTELLGLADRPDVAVTLSGLEMACSHPFAPLREHIRSVLASFGPARVLWGSNFPIACAEEARRVLALLRGDSIGLLPAEVTAVIGGSARAMLFEGAAAVAARDR